MSTDTARLRELLYGLRQGDTGQAEVLDAVPALLDALDSALQRLAESEAREARMREALERLEDARHSEHALVVFQAYARCVTDIAAALSTAERKEER